MAAVSENKVGFECKFVEDPPKYLQTDCPVCLHILREPYQVTCCGKSFCKECIERVKRDRRPCTCCNQDNFNDFPNKGLQQPLYGFKVHCSNKEEGCEWRGELGQLDNHLNLNPQTTQDSDQIELEGCQLVEIKCTYCSDFVPRKELLHHKNGLCDKRPFSCEYCTDYESTYEDVIHNHWPVCGHHPVQCPNKCGAFPQHQNINNHLALDCPLTVVECDFNYAGCEVRLPRQNMSDHLRDGLVTHFSLLALSHRQQRDEICVLKEEVRKLKSHVTYAPADFTVVNIDQYTATKPWISPQFYSHCCGYKLCILIFKSQNTNIYILHPCLMQGEFDSVLKWPFKAVIRIKILNKHGENIELKPIDVNNKRVQGSDQHGVSTFLSSDKISKCLDDGCLHFRGSVEF